MRDKLGVPGGFRAGGFKAGGYQAGGFQAGGFHAGYRRAGTRRVPCCVVACGFQAGGVWGRYEGDIPGGSWGPRVMGSKGERTERIRDPGGVGCYGVGLQGGYCGFHLLCIL